MSLEPQSLPQMDKEKLEEQLYLYARDLRALYEEEKKEREALAEEKLVLQMRLKELTALNHLFQQHLERRQRLEETLQEVAAGLKQLLAGSPQAKLRQRLEQLLAVTEQVLAAPVEEPLPMSRVPGKTQSP